MDIRVVERLTKNCMITPTGQYYNHCTKKNSLRHSCSVLYSNRDENMHEGVVSRNTLLCRNFFPIFFLL